MTIFNDTYVFINDNYICAVFLCHQLLPNILFLYILIYTTKTNKTKLKSKSWMLLLNVSLPLLICLILLCVCILFQLSQMRTGFNKTLSLPEGLWCCSSSSTPPGGSLMPQVCVVWPYLVHQVLQLQQDAQLLLHSHPSGVELLQQAPQDLQQQWHRRRSRDNKRHSDLEQRFSSRGSWPNRRLRWVAASWVDPSSIYSFILNIMYYLNTFIDRMFGIHVDEQIPQYTII